MPEHIRDTKNGRFAGSIGKGKTGVPTVTANKPRKAPQPRLITTPRQYASLNERTKNRLVDVLLAAHNNSNIDGYGDEGAGYDYDKQIRLLLAAGWKMPEMLPRELPTKLGSKIVAPIGNSPTNSTEPVYGYLKLTSKGWESADGTIVELPNLNEDEGGWWLIS